MITDNDKRRDKFCEMDHIEFNNCIAFALRNGDRKVAYSKIKDAKHMGGTIKKNLKLKDRTYKCDNCGTVLDRDWNASINLAMYDKNWVKSA